MNLVSEQVVIQFVLKTSGRSNDGFKGWMELICLLHGYKERFYILCFLISMVC